MPRTLAVLIVVVGCLHAQPTYANPATPDAEVARIQRHLDRALALLESADTAHLSRDQLERRRFLVERLRAYRDRGVFPRNTEFPGVRVPYFVDRGGRLCAVAYLVHESGFAEVVERIAERENNARVHDMTDPALPGWLEHHGLSLDEAATIQPTYTHQACARCGCDVEPVCGADGLTYQNACIAQHCGGVRDRIAGCCVDSPVVSHSRWCSDEVDIDTEAACEKLVDPPESEDCACGVTETSPGAVGILMSLLGLLVVRRATGGRQSAAGTG